jgi:hypothetical protein
MSATEIQPVAPETILVRRDPSPMELIQRALDQPPSLEQVQVVERLWTLQKELLDRQARIDFDEALNRCQKAVGRITPNVKRKDTDSWWADYAELDKHLRPVYTGEGFSISYSEVPPIHPGKVRICAIMSRAGASREFFHEITPSTTGPKGNVMATATDADAIAASRAKRYILTDIFNIAAAIDKKEKEAVPEAQREFMAEATIDEWVEAMKQAPDFDALKGIFSDCWGKAKKLNDQNAKTIFQKVYEAQKRSLL